MRTPGAGSLRVTVAFRDPIAGDASNRCSSAVQAFRTGPSGTLVVLR
jgi:hypothetical protein